MKKRMISLLLVLCMVLSMLPMSVLAAPRTGSSDSSTPYLEVKKDKNGNECTVKPYNAPDGSAVYFAYYDVNGRMLDVEIWPVDASSHKFEGHADARYAKAFLLDQETNSPLSSEQKVLLNTATYQVSFYDGNRLIETLEAVEGEPLGAVPGVEKSSKANAFLVGYFTDTECTQPFYAENPVTSNMNVYAKYEEMGTGETLTFTSFAQMDQGSDISFEISGSGNPEKAVTLEVMDGSDPVELKFTGGNGNYTVSAVNGFNEGCSYQLHLAEGWNFVSEEGEEMPETIRTASFSISKEQVENLRMNDDIVYIEDTGAIDYTVNGQSYDMLTSELVTEQGGSFKYSDATIEVGDILCVYTGTHPEQRDMGGDTLDPAIYVKAAEVSGSTVTFTDDYAYYHDVLNPRFDRAVLLEEGFTTLEITIQFAVKEINNGYQDLKLEAYHSYDNRSYDCSGDSYDQYGIAYCEFESGSGWTYHRQTISLDLSQSYIDEYCRFLVAYDAHGSGDDDWYLGDTHYIVTAKK